jgi:hypothetical protein
MRKIGAGVFVIFLAMAGYFNAQAYQQRDVPVPLAPVEARVASVVPSQVAAWGRATVRVEDHTGSRWNVRRAVTLWERGTIAHVVYAKCVHAMPCIRLYEGNYGKSGYLGITRYESKKWVWNGRRWIINGVTRIYFNDWYVSSVRNRDMAACHELGHGLGIISHSGRDSCMYFRADGHTTVPTNADRAALNGAYKGVKL